MSKNEFKIFSEKLIMKKIFIYMSIFTILFIAFCDARMRTKELDEAIAATNLTPSQTEIRKPLNRQNIESNSLKLQENNYETTQDKIRQQTKQHLENSINKPNSTQKNPLHWR